MSGHDALAFATPGHDTDPNRDFLNEIERISALIHQVHGEPVTLGGYSMGGRLALGLALRHPEQVCRLVLISSRRGLDTEEERLARRASDERWARLAESLGLEEFLDRWWEAPLFASLKAVPEERLSVERANRSGLSPDGIIWALRRLGLGRQPSYAQEIASLQPPATLIVGGLDDKFRALNEELARQLPRARLLVVKDHGHSLPLEAPEAVGRAIAEED
jgi:2-succinyl-6-hydroxy-2,4-cyclohexadiene-1-carboxylate synthase